MWWPVYMSFLSRFSFSLVFFFSFSFVLTPLCLFFLHPPCSLTFFFHLLSSPCFVAISPSFRQHSFSLPPYFILLLSLLPIPLPSFVPPCIFLSPLSPSLSRPLFFRPFPPSSPFSSCPLGLSSGTLALGTWIWSLSIRFLVSAFLLTINLVFFCSNVPTAVEY